MEIAQFKNNQHGFIFCAGKEYEMLNDYTRISEYVEVEFPPRDMDEERIAKTKALQAQIEEQTKKLDELKALKDSVWHGA